MKVIFLDFDGVLRSLRSMQAGSELLIGALPDKVDARCVMALNRIVIHTGARIVVSSSWRGRYVAPVRRLLTRWQVEGKVIGVTPRLERLKGGLWTTVPRGREIAMWLAEHKHQGKQHVESFVILDDDADMGSLARRLIQTSFDVGLTEADADRAIEMLRS